MRFFKQCNVIIQEKEALNIIKRMDVDKDGKVSLVDFKIFFPLSRDNKRIWQESLYSTLNKITNENYDKYMKSAKTIDDSIKLSTSQIPTNPQSYNRKNNISIQSLKPKEKVNNENLKSMYESLDNFHFDELRKEFEPKDPLNEEIFIEYLLDIVNMENQVDRVKVEISLKPDYNFIDAFTFFENQNNKGKLNSNDCKNGYNCFGMNPNNEQILLLFQRYAKNKDYLE